MNRLSTGSSVVAGDSDSCWARRVVHGQQLNSKSKGNKVDWVKLGVRYYADAKIAGLPDDIADSAEVMWTRGLARAGEERAQGFIPESAIPELTRRRRYEAVADALVATGLWSRVPGGYQVARWADWQDALDALTKRRESDAERKRKSRAAEREALVRKYGDRCMRCGTTENLIIDHGSPKSRGGKDVDDNKHLLCWSCNARKRNLTDDEYTAWLAARGNPPPNPTPANKQGAGVTLSADKRTLSADTAPLSADMSADVRPLEGEKEKDPRGRSKRDTYVAREAGPEPPRQCIEHLEDPDPPPCGRCKRARQVYEQWEQQWLHEEQLARHAEAVARTEAKQIEIDRCRLCDPTGKRDGLACPHDPGIAERTQRGAALAAAAIRKPQRLSRNRPGPVQLARQRGASIDPLNDALAEVIHLHPEEVPDVEAG